MRRRQFITLIGGATATLLSSHSTFGQSPSVPVVGFISSGSPVASAPPAAAFRAGLAEGGFAEGRNVKLEYRWAEGDYERLPVMAADLVRRQAAVIFAGGPPAAHAAVAATSSIPIVFTSGDDPVQVRLVKSLNRPGGNVTGVHIFLTGLEPKRLGLLREAVPQAEVIAATEPELS